MGKILKSYKQSSMVVGGFFAFFSGLIFFIASIMDDSDTGQSYFSAIPGWLLLLIIIGCSFIGGAIIGLMITFINKKIFWA
jgi:hypothetical protein